MKVMLKPNCEANERYHKSNNITIISLQVCCLHHPTVDTGILRELYIRSQHCTAGGAVLC